MKRINAYLSRLELIWPISSLKISKMSKIMRFGKTLWESIDRLRLEKTEAE